MTDKEHHEIFAAAFGPWGQVGAAWAEAMSDLGAETMRFLAARVQEDVGFQQRILHASSLDELRHIQGAFVQKAIDQYVAETGRMVEMNEELAEKLGLPTET
jgi:hypothetical protein